MKKYKILIHYLLIIKIIYFNVINSLPINNEQKYHIFDAKIENTNLNEIISKVEEITTSSSLSAVQLVTTASSTEKIPGNDLLIGECKNGDQRVYTDNTVIENNGPSTLNGTLEIYIDSPIKITCIKIEDQITDGTGAIPSLNSGGIGYNWVFIDVQAKYGKGFHFNIHIFGVPV